MMIAKTWARIGRQIAALLRRWLQLLLALIVAAILWLERPDSNNSCR